MTSRLLLYKHSTIHYLLLGAGEKTAICFHGYGEDAGSFEFLEERAGKEFRFITIDLPFHGKTVWNEGLNFTTTDLQAIVEAILKEAGLKNHSVTLVGFSLGGRMVLSLYESISHQIEKIVLLAPDGLKVNFWYWLSTQTLLGKRLFRFTMEHPNWFFRFLKLINALGFVNRSIFKFVNYYIDNKNIRQLLYQRWTCLRKLRPNLAVIKKQITDRNTQVRLLYGKHDRIILPVRGEKFCKGLGENVKLSIIESGHQVLHDKHWKEIVSALQQ